ncbi:hypothetical protein KCP77_21625 [Salmonella enterica subsp. enterica]|nr:hypothetical protein KCP77_21625 [Salmonella enterica subsp. enterica]
MSISNSDNVPYLIQSWAQSIDEISDRRCAVWRSPSAFRLMAGKRTYCELSVPRQFA